MIDPDIRNNAFKAENPPEDREIGWVGDSKFTGQEDKVTIELDPEKAEGQFAYHTHPAENPSQLTAMPSEQDLVSAIVGMQEGLKGIVIFSGQFFSSIVPTGKADSYISGYTNRLSEGDVEGAIRALKNAGFEVEVGQL